MFGYLKKHTLHEISQLEVVSAVQMQLSALVLFVVFIFFLFGAVMNSGRLKTLVRQMLVWMRAAGL